MMAVAEKAAESVKKAAAPKKAAPAKAAAKVPAKNFMASRIKPDEIIRMTQLYEQYGNYADVAREVGRAASTVAKYIKLSGTPKPVKQALRRMANK